MNPDISFPLRTPYLVTSREFPMKPEQLEPVLSKMYAEVSSATNNRTISIYDTQQIATGEKWFNTGDQLQNKRQAYRKVFQRGAIAAGTTDTFAHSISGITMCTHIYGTCVTDVPDFRPIPYSSATDVTAQIELLVDATSFTIINGTASENITSATIVLEYLLN